MKAPKPACNPVIFLFNRPVKLTSVKVISVAALETNQYALPLWELVSDSNSVPLKDFVYGMTIRGMKPAVKGAVADPLVPGAGYRIFIQAGPEKAQHDFVPVPRTS